jgi:hypothetical protein
LIEVVCASVEDMTQEQAFYMKVWVGYITAETFGEMVVLRDDSEAVNYPFLYEESDGYLPFAPALIEALEERFSFLSAESGRGGEDGSAALGEPLGALGPRVSRLEDLLGKMSVSLETVLEKVSTGSSKPSTPKVQFAAKPKVIPGAHRQEGAAKFPSLDPSVVASALSAGVPEENLREMERLMGASSKGKKLREPALRKPARKVAEGVLSESEDEVEEAESGSPTTAAQEPGTMEGALSKLTELVTLLSADKIKRAKSSKVDIALENLGANTGGDSSTGSTGKRAAAGRRALRLALQEAPEDISNVIEKLILEDLTLQTVMPGMPKKDFNARAWVEHRSRIGAYKSSAYLLVAHARARACLMLVMIDQVAIDRGNWARGAELMLEQGPPLSALASHTLPSISDGESPFSKILDSRWAEVMLSHLKDAEDYVQKRKALGKKITEETEKDIGRAKPKPKPKGKSQSEAAETA